MIVVNTPWQGKKRFRLEVESGRVYCADWEIKDGCLIVRHGREEVTIFAAGHWIGIEVRDE